MSEVPSVDALIVSFNTGEALRNTLTSLLEHSPPADVAELRVSVFDNGSSDGSADMVVRCFPNARLIASAINLGFGRANNRLASTSTADYLLLLNSDMVVIQDIVTPLMRALREDPRLIATGPRLVHPDGRVQYSAHRLPTLPYEFAQVIRGKRLGRAMGRVFDSEKRIDDVHQWSLTDERVDPRTPEFLWATCWLVRRADVATGGLFDDEFPMYDEDLDFCYRARARGRTFRYVSSAEIIHLGGLSSKSGAEKLRLMTRARQRYYRRHHGRLIAALYAGAVPAVQRLAMMLDAVPRPRRTRR
ncbi:MAG: glycosyltransferase family 2 protein [Actinomycetota bacterium]|nr:glycosyltransferase family 2 protein [Actinomycetota bacterium]